MTAQLIDGNALAKKIRAEVAERASALAARGRNPGLAVILVGDDHSLQANATVTVCHSGTADIGQHTRMADVVVAAVGRRKVLTADMVKPGAVIIDVGMNRNDDGKLCGDVDFAGVSQVAGWITPVPGGVGPMTRAMLLVNTLEAAERATKL